MTYPKKVVIILLSLQALLLGTGQVSFCDEKGDSSNCPKTTERLIEKKAGDYRVRVSHDSDWICNVKGEFRKIDEIYGGDSDFEIIDLNHDGIPEIRLADDFLAYRFSSFGTSAMADVILKYVNGHYSVAPELMRKPARLESFNQKIPKWRKLLREHSDPDWPPQPLIQAMTDLIFTGNESLAFRLVDKVWSQDIPGKDDFLKSYREALADSKYYPGLKEH